MSDTKPLRMSPHILEAAQATCTAVQTDTYLQYLCLQESLHCEHGCSCHAQHGFTAEQWTQQICAGQIQFRLPAHHQGAGLAAVASAERCDAYNHKIMNAEAACATHSHSLRVVAQITPVVRAGKQCASCSRSWLLSLQVQRAFLNRIHCAGDAAECCWAVTGQQDRHAGCLLSCQDAQQPAKDSNSSSKC